MHPLVLARVASVAVVIAVASSAAAQTAPSIVSAWVAAPAAGATSARVFVEVANPTMYEIYITGATSDAAPKVELLPAAAGGSEPAPIAEFPVPAYGGTAAAATAPHLRLVGLTKPLAAGDMVQLSLTTDGGLTLKVAAAVRQP